MKIGISVGGRINEVEKLKDCNPDFVEIVFHELADLTESESKALRKSCDDSGIEIYSANCMLRADLPIVVENPKLDLLSERLEKTFENASILGIKCVVFGSGGSRNIPEGSTKEEATARLVKVTKEFLAPYFEKYHMTCVIEPLSDSTLINKVSEGLEVVKAVNNPRIGLLADLYHMDMTNDSLDELYKCKGYFKHIHVARKGNRAFPVLGDGNEYHCKKFFRILREIGYDGTIAIEGDVQKDFFAEAKESIAFLRTL
ncbi:MAG: sugar phosphate isomerase/epimerase [Clostridia bacterium]|nr:sugar phosphate isomerase/epimerase [Clostridia bacterium]